MAKKKNNILADFIDGFKKALESPEQSNQQTSSNNQRSTFQLPTRDTWQSFQNERQQRENVANNILSTNRSNSMATKSTAEMLYNNGNNFFSNLPKPVKRENLNVKGIKEAYNTTKSVVGDKTLQELTDNNGDYRPGSTFQNVIKQNQKSENQEQQNNKYIGQEDSFKKNFGKGGFSKITQENIQEAMNNVTNAGATLLDDAARVADNIVSGGFKGIKDAGDFAYTFSKYPYNQTRELAFKLSKKITGEAYEDDGDYSYLGTLKKVVPDNSLIKDLTDNTYNKKQDIKSKLKSNSTNIDDYLNKEINKNIEEATNPVSKEIAEVAPSIGQQLPATVMGPFSAPYFFLSAGGSYKKEGLARGMSEDESTRFALPLATLEMATEKFTFGRFTKTAGLSKAGMTKQLLKEYGINAADNFVQEAVMEPLTELNAQIIGDEYANWNGIWERFFKAGFDGSIMSILMDGSTYGINTATSVTNKLQNNEDVSKQELVKAIKDVQDSGKVDVGEIFKENMNQQANKLKDYLLSKGVETTSVIDKSKIIDEKLGTNLTSEIQKALNEGKLNKNTYSELNKQLDQITQLKNSEDLLNHAKELDDTLELKDTEHSLTNVVEKLTNEAKLDNETYGKLKDVFTNIDNNIPYVTETSDNKKIDTFRDDMTKFMNNSVQSHNFAKSVESIIEKTGLNIRLNNQLADNLNGAIYNQNGETIIEINPNSESAGEFVLMHELTHAIGNQDLKQTILDYANKNKEFDAALKDLKARYGQNDVTEEVMADISGQLLGNEEFINSLAQEQPSKFKQIYNAVKSWVKKFTGTYRYEDFVKDVEMKWRKAYEQNKNSITENIDQKILNNKTTLEEIPLFSKNANENSIQGLESYSRQEIKDISKRYIQNLLEDEGINANIEDIEIHGSRNRGTARADSDLDIVVQYNGDIREDDLFNLLNEDPLEIDGIKVDINPIQENLQEYMQRSNKYDQQMLKSENGEALEKNGEIEYNYDNNGIILNSWYEKQLDSAIMTDNPNLKINQLSSKEFGDNFYLFEKVGDGEYKKYLEIPIQGNEDIINILEEARKDGEFSNVRSIHEAIDEYRNTRTNSNGTYNSNEKQNTEDGRSSRFYREKSKYNTRQNSQTNNENSNGIKSSEKSSFILPKNNKAQQLDIIKNNNPMQDDYHTGIRSIEDIKTLQEALNESEYDNQITPDLTNQDIENAIKTGKITVYSSNQIEQGAFVTPSKMEAQNYAGNNKIYSKEVNINDVAWIDTLEGQYAKTEKSSTTDNQGRTLTKEQQEYFKDSKARDENGNLLTVYHGTNNDFTIFDKSYLGTASGDVGFLGDGIYLATHKGEAGYYGSNIMSGYVDIKNPFNIKELIKYDGSFLDGEDSSIGLEIYNLVNMNEQWGDITIDGYSYNEIANETKNFLENAKVKRLGDVEDFSGNITGTMWEIDYKGKKQEIESIPNYTQEKVFVDSLNDNIKKEFGYLDSHEILQNITHEHRENPNIKSFSQVLQEKGFDSVVQGTPQTTDEILIFDSSQFKNIDNTNPTNNPDISYSKQSDKWQQFLDKNFPSRGTTNQLSDMKQILPTKESSKTVLEAKKQEIAPNTTEDAFVPFRTSEQIANDTNISNLEALKEESEQVNVPSKKIAEQVEKELASKDIEKSPTIDFIKEKRSKEKTTFKEIKDELAQKFVNKGHYIDKLAKQTKNKKLTWLYDRTMNSFNEAQISIGDNQINSNGEVVGKSIIDIFKPAEEKKLTKEFNDYLLNKHNIARYGYEKGVFGTEVSAEQSKQIVDYYEKKHPEFKEWGEEASKYNDNNLVDLVDNGLVSDEMYKKLRNMYPDYVPTFRDITEDMSNFTVDDRVGTNTLKKATGSNLDILSVQESMAEQTLAIKKAIRMNNLGLELYNTLHPSKSDIILSGVEFDPSAMMTLNGDVVEKNTDGTNMFTIFDDGEMKTFKISDELYSAFKKDTLQNKINNSKAAKALLTPLEKLSKFQRELLTTYSIGFSLNNPIKDFSNALVNTKFSDLKFIKNYPKALYNLATKGDWYKSYKNNGGYANTYFDYDKGLLPTKTKNPIKKFANKIAAVNEVLEQAPRLTEYISTIENGGTIDEALYNAADVTVNFKRGGDITKAVNKYGANFLNASVQGLDKTYRNIIGQNGVKGYTRLMLNATIASIAPAIINNLVLGDDDDYEELPDYIKDNYFLFKIGDNKFFRIPKGNVSAVVGSIARRANDAVEGKEVNWKSLVDTTVNQLAPNNPVTDNVLAPLIQAKNNKAWYGGDIVSTRLQKLPAAEQYDEKTDSISKFLGKTLNISPKKINYVLDQYSGGLGDVILPTLTPQAENNILEDKLTTNSTMKSKYPSEFFSKSDELQIASNSENATDEDKLKYMLMNELKSGKNFKIDGETISTGISDLYTQKRAIQNSSVSDKEKKEELEKVQKQINTLARYGIENSDNIEIDGNTATIPGSDFKWINENGTWKKVDDKTKTKLKQNNISLESYANYQDKVARYKSNLQDDESLKQADKIKILRNMKMSDKDKKGIYSAFVGTTDTAYDNIKNNVKINDYLDYKTDVSGLTKNTEKIQKLKQANYSSQTKQIIYENTIGKDDEAYAAVKNVVPIDSYLDYKSQSFYADKDSNGKSISGSRKQKIIDYLNSSYMRYEDKLIILGMNNKLSSSELSLVFNYVNSQSIPTNQKIAILKKVKGFTVNGNNVNW